jgi:diguanylate cyclase (GGDEF)-like protein
VTPLDLSQNPPAPAEPAVYAELDELKSRLRVLREEAAANEQKLRRNHEREIALLRAETLPELFAAVTSGLGASFALDAVSLVLEDPNHEIRHLLIGAGHPLEEFPDVLIVDSLAALAPQLGSLYRPWLGAYVRPDHELLFPRRRGLASLALVPLGRQGRATGMLCFASQDAERFTHRMASDFLQHLGAVVAVCVENACNRARVLRSGLADYLTGWHNRRYLHARMREELARAQRHGGPVSCLMIDVDWFKSINDQYGHLGGDEALKEITGRIEAQVRASDTAARFGGDEFALLLPNTPMAEAGHLADRIRAVMAAPVELGAERFVRITLSMGAATVVPGRADHDLKALADQLLAQADAALYSAKAAGRDRVVLGPEKSPDSTIATA